MNSLQAAVEGKGIGRMLKRGNAIGGHYGWSTGKMDRAMNHFVRILESFNCGATFPLTAIALTRNNWPLESYRSADIEFAVHGLCHVDHSRLSLQQQLDDFARARALFEERGIAQPGFRCPYLRWSDDTMTAAKQVGFRYDSSQSLAWPLLNGLTTETYGRVLSFYRAKSAADYPALPSYEDGIIRMPYSLPDDEALVDRLALSPKLCLGHGRQFWPRLTDWANYLFWVFIRNEFSCESALIETLRAARSLSPGVWIARLDEIASWWTARTHSMVRCDQVGEQTIRVGVSGPKGLIVLARGVETPATTELWDSRYRRVHAADFEVTAERRPFIGITSRSSTRLASFLRQQGYIVEQAGNDRMHALTLDHPEFSWEDERSLLATIEDDDSPLVKFGRWPDGYRSALSITGDIDALTLWDYGLRLFGR